MIGTLFVEYRLAKNGSAGGENSLSDTLGTKGLFSRAGNPLRFGCQRPSPLAPKSKTGPEKPLAPRLPQSPSSVSFVNSLEGKLLLAATPTKRLFAFLLDLAWIGSIHLGACFFVSPLVTSLCRRFGCRITGIVGGLLCVLGLALSSLTRSIDWLCVTYGVIAGIGCGLCYITTFRVLSLWFDR